MEKIISILNQMKSDTLHNYVIAGLDSSLLRQGKVRYFENSRNHLDSVTPHSHRFDFTCLVLQGEVTNTIWEECDEDAGDLFEVVRLEYEGFPGKHRLVPLARDYFKPVAYVYGEGETYSMEAEEVHSIQFSRGAKVLFFEGPSFKDYSYILQPVVNGKVIPTYETKDYMFKEAIV